MDTKKKNVSLRLSESDIDRVRKVSNRLEVKEADVLRFAVKYMLTKLAPFQDETYVGTDLMPAVLEVGQELVGFFDMTSEDLDHVINHSSTDEARKVDLDDLKLLALAGINENYAKLKMNSTDSNNESVADYLSKKYFCKSGASNEEKQASEKARPSEWPFFVAGSSKRVIPETA